ncbi:MAG TPA: lysine 2,3-aminomutase [Stackebrandtia sp.]|jgi:KamA family protein|uniref:KamA family radical SAM protein n=1 Tax=Stackebrandtia sp. TaxID=2023065 RepID=UPI002D2D3B60|nr:lysine 2,3-aminomutase [Stackebrandtia sp.]HZE39540.1 lysine 2,3-aminomutase [Stackebrandtia sp.]
MSATTTTSQGRKFRAYTSRHLDELLTRAGLPDERRLRTRAVSTVLPFRTNDYVLDELIDWDNAEDDPMFRLVFPQEDMLDAADVTRLAALLDADPRGADLKAEVHAVRRKLNPHPAGQLVLNKPKLDGEGIPGMQHKYPETILFFPQQGQTCHAYCTYCFRWAQFVGEPDLKMATNDIDRLVEYIRARPSITSVLFTGGDAMIMGAPVLRRYVEPLLELEQLESIRMGTKALAYWPQRFVTDPDADDTMRLFEQVVASGKNLAFQAHFSHPAELRTEMLRTAVKRIQSTGAIIRTQAPLIRTINDDAQVWTQMWRTQHTMGMIPYYMFVERDTGPQDYFSVPLVHAYEVFQEAYSQVSGLCRTVRGPSMSADPGKVSVDGVTEINGTKVFVLHMIQARDPKIVGKPFFAHFDADAVWLNDLKPAFAEKFPFE